jgi:HSP20 family protein
MSFFEKLKGSAEAIEEEYPKKKGGKGKPKAKKPQIEKTEIKPEVEPEKKSPPPKKEEPRTGGQLALDIYETDDDFIIQSTVAGVKPEDLDISIEGDLVSVRGTRQRSTQEQEEGKYLYQECYWGEFSREVILPEEVDAQKAEAKIKDGVLTLRIPKARKTKRKKIAVISSE